MIILAFLFILLVLLTFLSYSSFKENRKNMETVLTDNAKEESAYRCENHSERVRESDLRKSSRSILDAERPFLRRHINRLNKNDKNK